MIFKYKSSNNFSFRFLDNLGNKIPVFNWEELQSDFLSQLAILNELHDNGLADYTDNTCEVASIDILRLSKIDKQILELPDVYL